MSSGKIIVGIDAMDPGWTVADDAFSTILLWLVRERDEHQQGKFDYADEDLTHALEGLGEGSWFWDHGVMNYVPRVRMFWQDGITTNERTGQLGAQALMKTIATLIAQMEHLMRAGILKLPEPGVPSGEIKEWQP